MSLRCVGPPVILVCENEVDPGMRYYGRALREYLPAETAVYDYVSEGGSPPLDDVDAVVLGGSTAGVYESDDHPWMDDERAFVRRLVDERVPTLGVCFGHQLVNDALGGAVDHVGMRSRLAELDFEADPLFDGVSPVVPMVHGDVVTELGDGLEPIAAADYYPYVATRHREAPLWTVQYHPEFTESVVERVAEDLGWFDATHPFDAVSAVRTLDNFVRLVTDDA